MDEIGEIDDQLTPIFRRLVALSRNLSFSFVCELSDEESIAKQTYKGIYRIDVSTSGEHADFEPWIAEFRAEWDLPEYKKMFTCTTKDKRIKRHGILEEWMPLYIGKSKKVGSRVTEHLNLPLEARTFALKIRSRPNMSRRKFRLFTIPLHVENYDLIAPSLERELRDHLNPIVGKQ